MSEQQFLFDDFFVSADDPGVEVEIEAGGVKLPIRVKKRFTLEDIESARDKAIQRKFNLQTGEFKVEKVDDGAFVLALMQRGIVSWPFKYRDGKPVPVNEKTLKALDSRLYEQLSQVIAATVQQKREQTAPLEKTSVEA